MSKKANGDVLNLEFSNLTINGSINGSKPDSSSTNTSEQYSFSVSALRQWLIAFVVVDFNVDVGPEIELVYPMTPFSQGDLTTLCFSSFPERTNSDTPIGEDSSFHFRFRHSSPDISKVLNSEKTNNKGLAAVALGAPPACTVDGGIESPLLHAFVIFRQSKSPLAKRAYEQKSLVCVSQHDLGTLFRNNVIRALAAAIDDALPKSPLTPGSPSITPTVTSPSGFDKAAIRLVVETACAQIAAWPKPPLPGQGGSVELPFLGELWDLEVPQGWDFPVQGRGGGGIVSSRATSPTRTGEREKGMLKKGKKEIFASEPLGYWAKLLKLMPNVGELYVLFEKLVLCEPIVVLADDPTSCSEFISALLDLVRPIPYGGDVRPYLTMQSDFFTNANEAAIASKHYIIGITNPFLLKRLHSEVHVIYVGPQDPKKRDLLSRFGSTLFQIDLNYGGYSSTATSAQQHKTAGLEMSSATSSNNKGRLGKDASFLKELGKMIETEDTSAEEIGQFVRKHFSYLSNVFLAPLNRYLATLMSNPSHELSPKTTNGSTQTSSTRTPPTFSYLPFSENDFFESLHTLSFSSHSALPVMPFRHKVPGAFPSRRGGMSSVIQGVVGRSVSDPMGSATSSGWGRDKVAESFYRDFVRSPNFWGWWMSKVEMTEKVTGHDYPEHLLQGN